MEREIRRFIQRQREIHRYIKRDRNEGGNTHIHTEREIHDTYRKEKEGEGSLDQIKRKGNAVTEILMTRDERSERKEESEKKKREKG